MAFFNIPQEYKNKSVEQLISDGSGGLPLIPDGKYVGLIVKSELKETSKGGTMLVLDFVITQGEHRDTEFKDNLNIVNDNATAVKIAFTTLAKISRAIGLADLPEASEALHNKPMVLVIKKEEGREYTDKLTGEVKKGKDFSKIAGYEPMPSQLAGSVNAPPTTSGAIPPVGASALPWA